MPTQLLTQVAKENQLLERLPMVAKTATSAFIAVSFASKPGIEVLLRALRPMLEKDRQVEVFVSGFLGITSVDALRDLLRVADNYPRFTVRFNAGQRFHAKLLLFWDATRFTAFVGSSNLTNGGFREEGELNVEVSGNRAGDIFQQAQVVKNQIRELHGFRELKKPDIDEYAKWRRGVKRPKGKKKVPAGWAPSQPKLTIARMPVYVSDCEYEDDEETLIQTAHPSWKGYLSYGRWFRNLRRNDVFLEIANIAKKPKTFSVCRYIEYDRIAGIGLTAHVKMGKKRKKLATLARLLDTKEGTLTGASALEEWQTLRLLKVFGKSYPRKAPSRS
jgi:HKD family nuclease